MIYDQTDPASVVEKLVPTLDEEAPKQHPLAFRLPFPRQTVVVQSGTRGCEVQTDGVPLVREYISLATLSRCHDPTSPLGCSGSKSSNRTTGIESTSSMTVFVGRSSVI